MRPSLKLRRQHVVSFFFLTSYPALFISLKFLFIYLVLVELGFHCCCQAFSSCSAQVSHWGAFSCCRAWALGSVGLVAPQQAKSSLTRDRTHALSSGFLTTGPAGKSSVLYLKVAIQRGVTEKQIAQYRCRGQLERQGALCTDEGKRGCISIAALQWRNGWLRETH